MWWKKLHQNISDTLCIVSVTNIFLIWKSLLLQSETVVMQTLRIKDIYLYIDDLICLLKTVK